MMYSSLTERRPLSLFGSPILSLALIQQSADLMKVEVPGGGCHLETLRPAVFLAQTGQELRQVFRIPGVLDAVLVDNIRCQLVPQILHPVRLHLIIGAAAGELLIGVLPLHGP